MCCSTGSICAASQSGNSWVLNQELTKFPGYGLVQLSVDQVVHRLGVYSRAGSHAANGRVCAIRAHRSAGRVCRRIWEEVGSHCPAVVVSDRQTEGLAADGWVKCLYASSSVSCLDRHVHGNFGAAMSKVERFVWLGCYRGSFTPTSNRRNAHDWQQ